MAEAPEYEELIGRATTISAMIHMGEKIAWGADTAVIDELAAALRASLKEIAYLDEQNEKHASIAEKALLRAEAAEAEVTRLREALTKIAVYDDDVANAALLRSGVYNAFDEPSSVMIARRALQEQTDE